MSAVASAYRMQVVEARTGHVVEYLPGSAVEMDFLRACVASCVARGVPAVYTDAMLAGVTQAVQALKNRVPPSPMPAGRGRKGRS